METTKKRIKAIAIIETVMPEDCWICDHVKITSASDRLFCGLARDFEFVDEYVDDRAPFCPLVPVEVM